MLRKVVSGAREVLRARRMPIFVAIGFLVAAGCGGGSDSSPPPPPPPPPAPMLALLAGSPDGPGFADGAGATARFNAPSSVAIDGNGNAYVADLINHTIRKITAAGVVSTFAGKAGVSGSADGTGAAASFYQPSGVATDVAGNVYVADTSNSTIRKISPAGAVTTFAGSPGWRGYADGSGTAARFAVPYGLTTDGAGNVYVADTLNYAIRKITPAGVVTTLAGVAGIQGGVDGPGATATFRYPAAIAVDAAGNVMVADAMNYSIRKITPAGVVSTYAGANGSAGWADGPAATARFGWVQGVAFDSAGNVYVSDSTYSTLRKITPAGFVTTVAGTTSQRGSTDATGADARFAFPTGLAADGAGNVLVADRGNNTIRRMTPAAVVTTIAGAAALAGSTDAAGAAARFNQPSGLTVDVAGNVYVADYYNFTIRRITPGGVVTTYAGAAGYYGYADGPAATARFSAPYGVAADAAGNLFVADTGNSVIRKITPAGDVTTVAGTPGVQGSNDGTGAGAQFNYPYGVATDPAGNVYVADSYNHTIRRITPTGIVTTLAGTAGQSGSADGTGTAAGFNYPFGIAADSAGNVYVADTNNRTLRKITPAGVVTTLAGQAGASGGDDGTGAAARFGAPYGVAVGSAGDIYVADQFNSTLRKVTPAGVVTTVVGQTRLAGFAPGALPGLIVSPRGVAISNTTLYVTTSEAVASVTHMP